MIDEARCDTDCIRVLVAPRPTAYRSSLLILTTDLPIFLILLTPSSPLH